MARGTKEIPFSLTERDTAVLPMRLGPASLQHLVVLAENRLFTLHKGNKAVFVVDNTGDDPDATLDGVCATGGGACTLRAAIQEANSATGPHSISFSGLVAGDRGIFPLSALPAIVEPVTLDGTTHPDGMVELIGVLAGAAAGLEITGGGSTVRAMVVGLFAEDGVHLVGSGSNTVEGCHLGTNLAGSANWGTGGNGVHVDNSNADKLR